MLSECIAVHHANRQLRTEFDVCPRFAAHDRSHMRLRDADDPIGHAVRSHVVHHLLLAIKLLNDQQFLVQTARQPRQAARRLGKFSDNAQITANELLADGFAHRARHHTPLLSNRQIGFAGTLTVGTWLRVFALRFVQDVD
jgi:hypothetical protein